MTKETPYILGTPLPTYEGGQAKQITFVVTQNCNMACRYCYITHKNQRSRMSFEVARRAVDLFLSQNYPQPSVVWDFIGGEPLLEIELVDEICDYIKVESYRRRHKWHDRYMFMFSTNGILYDDPRVQRFITKNHPRLSIGITIDGTERKHNLNRVYPDGRGSYRDVVRNVRLWLQQFPSAHTKVTFASQDLPYLKESIIHLWELGLRHIPANVVFEDVWQEGDDLVLEQQLRELADYVIENRLWNEVNCTFFGESLGFPNTEESLKSNWCGAGLMVAVDHQGLLYPCIRFMDYSLNRRRGYVLGDIEQGIDPDKLRPFVALSLVTQSPQECIDCEVASGCAWCQGWNYDSADTPTIYQRATYICRMHKARVRANEYYWARLGARTAIQRKNVGQRRRHLYILAAGDAVTHCGYRNPNRDATPISPEILQQGLEFARRHFYRPVLLHSVSGPRLDLPEGFCALHIVSSRSPHPAQGDIVVHDNEVGPAGPCDTAILLVSRASLHRLNEMVQGVLAKARRVNVMLEDVGGFGEEDLKRYEEQLRLIAEHLLALFRGGERKEVSVLTDRLDLTRPEDCEAGAHSLTLAPNGKLYICPAFYYRDPSSAVGDPWQGVDPALVETCHRRKAPLCLDCGAYHCRRCLFDGEVRTLQRNVPSRMQCVVSHTELKVTAWLSRELSALGVPQRSEIVVDALDPLETLPTFRRIASSA
ncbi:MAG: radical SAM peptide maturase, CXXX-repeat target family [Acetobacteraceae bacterium]|nr:radical SAM peptide maturase, CXXX-repeat target family [Acetobacteraceae bacterium]